MGTESKNISSCKLHKGSIKRRNFLLGLGSIPLMNTIGNGNNSEKVFKKSHTVHNTNPNKMIHLPFHCLQGVEHGAADCAGDEPRIRRKLHAEK